VIREGADDMMDVAGDAAAAGGVAAWAASAPGL